LIHAGGLRHSARGLFTACPFCSPPPCGACWSLPLRCWCDAYQTAWYELPSFYVFHVANAWEDETGVVKVREPVAGTWQSLVTVAVGRG
jgi:hypothetical protein